MARGERNARHDDRSPFIDPFFAAQPAGTNVFAGAVPGYSQPDAIDPTGYTLRDLELPGRIADGMIPDDVLAPLGRRSDQDTGQLTPGFLDDLPAHRGQTDTEYRRSAGTSLLVGNVAPSSYGMTYGPVPGGALLDESRTYSPSVFLGDPMDDPRAKAHLPPGWVARPADLGMEPHNWPGEFVGLPHAQRAAPLEYQSDPTRVGRVGNFNPPFAGVVPEHLQSTIETGAQIYCGYAGQLAGSESQTSGSPDQRVGGQPPSHVGMGEPPVYWPLTPGRFAGKSVYGGLYDVAYDDGYDQPPERGGYDALGRGGAKTGGAFGPPALSTIGQPIRSEVDAGDEYDVGVDRGEDPGWRRGRRISPLEPGYFPSEAGEGHWVGHG